MVIRFFQKVASYPKTLILIVLLITGLLTYQASQNLLDSKGGMIIDSSVEPFMARGSGTYSFFKQMRDVFGNEEVLVIALKPTKLSQFDLNFFLTVDELTRELETDVPEVKSVSSLTNTPRVDGACSGKSFFHKEGIGSTCESIIDTYNQQLECVRNKDKYRQILDSQEGQDDLDSGLDDMGDDLDLDGDEADDMEGDDAAMAGDAEVICTADILEKSERDIYRETNALIPGIMRELRQHTLIHKDLISQDFKTAALLIEFNTKALASDPSIQEKALEIQKKYASDDLRFGFSGQSREEYTGSVTLSADMIRILPWSGVLMLITLFLSFKSIRGMLIPITIVVVGILWTFGAFAISGFQMNLVTMVLPPLLIAVGSAYIIHFINQYFMVIKANPKATPFEITQESIKHITVPLTVTALTTLAGFAALTVSPLPAIKEMGIFACFGIAVIIFFTLTVVPAILSLLPVPKHLHDPDKKKKRKGLDDLLELIARVTGRHSKRFIVAWVLLGIVAVIGVTKVTVDSESGNFPEDAPIYLDKRMIENELAGVSSLRVIFSGKHSNDALQTANTINGIIKLRDWLTQKHGPNAIKDLDLRIDKVYTVIDYIDIYRNGLDNLKDKEVVNYFIEAKKRGFPKYLSDDKSLIQMNIRMQLGGTTPLLQLRDMLTKEIERNMPDLKVQYTGSGILTCESADNISKGQVQSICLALGIIFVILSTLFFSFKMGFVALYPNVAAIAIYFGTLGWLDIPIGVTISIIASIALGIGVDDTIHFLTHHNDYVNKFHDEKKASMRTLVDLGKPMIFTTVSLGLGFGIFYLADMVSQVMFGVLTAYTLAVCLITDMNFLPAIMMNTKLVTAWGYLGLKFQKELEEKSSLFKGMTTREIKLSTLMSYTRDLEPGEVLFEEKSMGDVMYVILDGGVDIYLDEKYHDKEIPLVSLGIGASFGEMGLFRHSRRSASTRANSKSKLLAINDKSLNGLRKRYPKIATKLFINLTANLGNIIADTQLKIAEKNASGTSEKVVAEPLQTQSLREIVDEIASDGVYSHEEEIFLNKLIYSDHEVDEEEQRELDRLNKLIDDGIVVRPESKFDGVFKDITNRQYNWLTKAFEVKKVPAQTRIFSQGDYGDYMLLVLDGKINLVKEIDGKQTPVYTVMKDDLIGAISIACSNFVRGISAVTLEDSEMIFISHKGLERMRKQNIRLATRFFYNLVCMLAERLDKANAELYG
jgi:uncharacterized protein